MDTSGFTCVFLALLVQVAVALPSFGTGNQIDKWNEVDDEHPGEILPNDYMMPMRDPNGREHEGNSVWEAVTKASESSTTVPPPTKTEDGIPKPVPERLTTVRPQTKTFPVKSVVFTSQTPQEKEHKPMIVLRISTHLTPEDELPAPTPTPRPPTQAEEEDCECVECEEAMENQTSGNGNGEEIDCQESETSTPQVGSASDVREEALSPLALLGNGREGETLEDVFRDVAGVMGRLSLLEKKQLFKSIPFSQAEEERMGLRNEKEMPKIITGIMMKVLRARSNDESEAPCEMEETNGRQESSEKQDPPIELSAVNRETRVPISGILLKSTIPREDWARRNIFEAMKANRNTDIEKKEKMITSINDIFRNRVNKPGRFVAVPNQERGYTGRLPPLRFPYEDEDRESGLSDIGQRREHEFVNRFINSLRPPKVSPIGPSTFNPFNGLEEYNDHMKRFDPQMKGLLDMALKQMAEREADNFHRIGVQMPVSAFRNLD